jgi:hypothetical protein
MPDALYGVLEYWSTGLQITRLPAICYAIPVIHVQPQYYHAAVPLQLYSLVALE